MRYLVTNERSRVTMAGSAMIEPSAPSSKEQSTKVEKAKVGYNGLPDFERMAMVEPDWGRDNDPNTMGAVVGVALTVGTAVGNSGE
jgi:hypothetical protein